MKLRRVKKYYNACKAASTKFNVAGIPKQMSRKRKYQNQIKENTLVLLLKNGDKIFQRAIKASEEQ